MSGGEPPFPTCEFLSLEWWPSHIRFSSLPRGICATIMTRVSYAAVNMSHFDLLIVGAGPAGSFAAELLAKGGANVALFDGRPEGEPKACGGGVTAKALKAWPLLLGAVGRTINELDLYSPSGKKLHLELDEPFAIYSRVVFDSYLRDRARKAGAKVFAEKISARKTKNNAKSWSLQNSKG